MLTTVQYEKLRNGHSPEDLRILVHYIIGAVEWC